LKYLGNHNFDKLRERVLNSVGQARPRDWPASSAGESAEYQRAQESGYDLTAVHWWVYENQDLNIELAFPWTSGETHWWVTKLYPGQFMPMHTDPHTHERNCKRYWIPLQDYEPGHIFIYKSDLIKNYVAGDIYEYTDSQDNHGAANIGHTTRVVLQVTEYI